jgi:hypothetical protein
MPGAGAGQRGRIGGAMPLRNMGLRASTIRSSQQAIKIKVVYLCLVGGERRGERRRVGSHARASSSTCS